MDNKLTMWFLTDLTPLTEFPKAFRSWLHTHPLYNISQSSFCRDSSPQASLCFIMNFFTSSSTLFHSATSIKFPISLHLKLSFMLQIKALQSLIILPLSRSLVFCFFQGGIFGPKALPLRTHSFGSAPSSS